MSERMQGLTRSHYCGNLSCSDIGKEVVVCGWTQRQRDLGSLIFIDLRDRTGLLQLAFDDTTDRQAFDKAFAQHVDVDVFMFRLNGHSLCTSREVA